MEWNQDYGPENLCHNITINYEYIDRLSHRSIAVKTYHDQDNFYIRKHLIWSLLTALEG